MAGDGPTLDPAPRGWLEKANDASVGIIVPIFIVVVAFLPLSEILGYWIAFAAVASLGVASLLLFQWLVAPMRMRRKAQDAERGIFACALKDKQSVCQNAKWSLGYVKADQGELRFQAKTGVTGPLFGPIHTYCGIREVGQLVKAPWTVLPGGSVITLDTDNGTVELAIAPSDVSLMTKRLRLQEI